MYRDRARLIIQAVQRPILDVRVRYSITVPAVLERMYNGVRPARYTRWRPSAIFSAVVTNTPYHALPVLTLVRASLSNSTSAPPTHRRARLTSSARSPQYPHQFTCVHGDPPRTSHPREVTTIHIPRAAGTLAFTMGNSPHPPHLGGCNPHAYITGPLRPTELVDEFAWSSALAQK